VPALLCTYLVAFVLAAALSRLVVRGALSLGVVDHPGLRKIHREPVPRLGGLAIYISGVLAVTASLALQRPYLPSAQHPSIIGVLTSATLILLVGAIDDIRGLRARVKLVTQLLAATCVYSVGVRIDVLAIDGFVHVPLGALSYPLTLLWIVGITNALNLIDGLDGLAAGIATVACGLLAVFGWHSGAPVVIVCAIALLGALNGFLTCNWHPARLFMGDSGSNLVGFVLASLALIGMPSDDTVPALAAFCLALSVPIFDTAFSMLRRVLERRSLFAPDRKHVHHQLLARGCSHPQAVAVLHTITLGAAAVGALAFLESGWVALPVLACGYILIMASFRWIGAVRLREAITTLRHNREIARRCREQRERFEELELLLQDVTTFEEWWRLLQLAAERMGCIQLKLHFDGQGEEDDRPLVDLTWQQAVRESVHGPLISTRVPIPHECNGCHLCAEIQVPVTDSLEMAARGVTLIGRLIDERRVPEPRSREVIATLGRNQRAALAAAASGRTVKTAKADSGLDSEVVLSG
jgi:UDP-GlcNAc:undecaprenyl-phosphate GlcNAc-1-phosphate transferase